MNEELYEYLYDQTDDELIETIITADDHFNERTPDIVEMMQKMERWR